jgi:hypothetical protein
MNHCLQLYLQIRHRRWLRLRQLETIFFGATEQSSTIGVLSKFPQMGVFLKDELELSALDVILTKSTPAA